MSRRPLHLLIRFSLLSYALACSHAGVADWDFQEIIVDEKPLQPHRITDVEIVDIDNDGQFDLWFSGSKIGRG